MGACSTHLVSAFQRFMTLRHSNEYRSGTNHTLYLSFITTKGEMYHI